MLFSFFFLPLSVGCCETKSLGTAAANRPNIPALNDGSVYVYRALVELSSIRKSRNWRNRREPCLSGTRSTKNLTSAALVSNRGKSMVNKSKTNSPNYGTASVAEMCRCLGEERNMRILQNVGTHLRDSSFNI